MKNTVRRQTKPFQCLQLGPIFRTQVRFRTFLREPVRFWSGFYFKSPEFMFSDRSSSFLRRSNQSQMTAADIKYLSIPKRSYINKYLNDGNINWYVLWRVIIHNIVKSPWSSGFKKRSPGKAIIKSDFSLFFLEKWVC